MTVRFEISSPSGQRTITIDRYTVLVVGRAHDADLRLDDDPHFSRRHFLLEVAPPACQLIDLESRNGTLVNGEPVTSTRLSHGDVISGGATTITFRIEQDSPDASTLELFPGESAHAPTAPPATSGVIDVDSGGTILQQIGPYRILREIGHGAMATVYQAGHVDGGDIVALKIIRSPLSVSETHRQLFLREARLMARLTHPRLVRFHATGFADEQIYLAMEYVSHEPFHELALSMPPRKRIRFACGILSQTLDVLEYIHSEGVVHRDVKPANLLLSNDGGRLVVKVADLGLAKNFHEAGLSGITSEGEARGTIAFMPQEQLAGSRDVGPAADLYSAAATLYWYLTGEFPYEFLPGKHPIAVALSQSPVPISERRPDLPEDLCEIITRAMMTDPAKRYQTAAEMREDLRPFLRKAGE
ncbi:Serine/threonine-protein kinase StkP [Maioricimonas rarisocia]|uniref:non-specific serine/threonine protein kinase n=1 Tax=Maioricimonas rarisocia TaxID=2528026 RepID=A0A517ZAR2_9PLAN|nr:FHA domain-containing serine/threonine-protein kinase [Maioricimonas rarisocia]QDU39548.1 Serine/threonine-protein kinase StkP [Maioricimonas rarisocia]